MKLLRIAGTLLILAPVAGCEDARIGGPDLGVARGTSQALSVITWNVYYGTDLNAVVTALGNADPTDDIPAFIGALTTLEATAWPARADAIAGVIAAQRPHAVGLQEIATYDIDLSGLGVPIDFTLPFLPILEAALANRGLHYAVAATVESFNAQPIPGVSVQDFNVLLVDVDRVEVLDTHSQLFAAGIGPVVPGVALYDGWVSATVRVNSAEYTIVNTHLTAGAGEQLSGLRYLQATELVQTIGAASPAIVMGDLNDVAGSLMHQVFQGAGFADAWQDMRPGVEGLTCCQRADLANDVSALDTRYDYILVRGIGTGHAGLQGKIDRVGANPSSKAVGPAGPLWPSDHAGLVARFVIPPSQR